MTQYDERVEKQRLKIAAEEWGEQVKDLHVFNSDTTSMCYTERKDGRVIDTRFNNGRIRRYIVKTEKYVEIGKLLPRKNIIGEFTRVLADKGYFNGK